MAHTIARAAGRTGELALRTDGEHLELIANGVFLMDTRDGRSERLLVRAAFDAATRPVRRVLVGGLGMGFSLAEVLTTRGIDNVVVVEVEPAVVAWNRSHTAAITGGDVEARRVECIIEDLVAWLRRHVDAVSTPRPVFDAICLDIDNGPDWLVTDANAWLYSDDGLDALQDHLAPGGALSVWCAAPSPEFERRVAARFACVHHLDVEVARGKPDRIVVAC